VTSTATVARTRDELAAARNALPGRVAVVMTMGALHEGHAALLRAARDVADSVVLTIFVNPLQFGAGEDFDRYPRTFDADLAIAADAGVDLVFAPTPDVVYPQPALVRVSAGPLGDVLEGASRPGHFDGVLTVVLKLLNLVRPDVALFGEKDAQQLACIRRMVQDLDVGVEILGVPTVREPDGLALSSRNRYLSPAERTTALALSRALATGDLDAGRAVLDAEPGVDLDYLERVDSDTFEVTPDGDLMVVAARVGTTRLIDNRPVVEPDRTDRSED
jgi:pantoate--beta-alanine ligase